MNRVCKTCNISKDTENYYIQRSRNWMFTECKTCCGERAKGNYTKGSYYIPVIKGSRRDYKKRYFTKKSSSKKRGIDFRLTFDDFMAYQTQKECNYCGLIMDPVCIDRVNNDGAYVLDNCVASCKPCNSSKGTMTKQNIAKKINYYRGKIKLLNNLSSQL